MGRLPRALEEKRVKLLALAQRRAFESYMRYGRVPELHERAAAFAVGVEKALGVGVDVSLAEIPRLKPTTYYTWRSAGDERVRSSHAALNGRIFAWNVPPAHGHPGAEPNCRCWAEPYYGNPAISDGSVKLVRERQTDAAGREHWASIETLTRPDGSLVESIIIGRDGTRFWSTFSGSSVAHQVTLPAGDKVRFETNNGVQSTYLGDDTVPLLQSAWTANGPKIIGARREVAFLLRNPTDPFGDVLPYNEPGPSGGPNPPGGLGPIVNAALVALYNMLQAAGTGLGAGRGDVPFIAFRAWQYDGNAGAAPVAVSTLTEEQTRQSCERLPEIRMLVDKLEEELASQRPILGSQSYGTEFHKQLKRRFDALKEAFPLAYEGVYAELSIDQEGLPTFYGDRGSTRLDILEEIPPGRPRLVCDYDVKTGEAGIKLRQLGKIAGSTSAKYPGVNFVIVEVKTKHANGR